VKARRAISPIGEPAAAGASRRAARSKEYREQQAQRQPWEAVARIVIRRRLELGLSQQEVADRMGTSHSAISRIESGLHPTKQDTLARLAEALEMHYVHGFQIDTGAKQPELELITV
jgi:ribosome-binding protein aMBF1 (putative translation factor)